MSASLPVIAIVGRTNVGKSTLFNLLAKKDIATVSDRSGVTRDRNYVLLNDYERPFYLVDTGGLLGEENPELQDAVHQQIELAIAEADLIIALFDAKHGLHPLDHELITMLRAAKKPVVYCANKSEKKDHQLNASEFYQLGIDDLQLISAAHNVGIHELKNKIWETLDIDQKETKHFPNQDVIKVAFLGKPNVGKSTLVNKILGEERMITSNIAGTTRDSLNFTLTREGQVYEIIDTAGLRKKNKIAEESLEQLFNFKTLRAITTCDIAILLIDATEGEPAEQVLKIADLLDQRGKGLILAVNKWDAIEKDHKTAKEYEAEIIEKLRFCKYAPIVFISALTGKRCPHLLKKAKEIYTAGQERIQTSELNKLLEKAITKNPPPIYRGQPVKFYFATQTASNPPTFVLFFNYPKKVSPGYVRYIKNYLRAQYAFPGYDLKVIIRKRRSEKSE